jgi:hypothetical protein
MIDLDEAIEYYEELAEDKIRLAKLCKNTRDYEDGWSGFEKSAKRYLQLVNWLKELKVYREKDSIKFGCQYINWLNGSALGRPPYVDPEKCKKCVLLECDNRKE